MKSFFSKVKATLEKWFGAANLEQTASATLSVIAPLITTILTLTVGTPVAAAVGGVISQVQADLAAAHTVLTTAGSTGKVTVTSLLAAVQTNLKTLLADADVKNSVVFNEVSTAANLIISELEAVIAAL
jgi:hypothetical protein